ncbi:MAG TPA: hypothetical protein DCS90_15760 [Ktedonobacter sp.]|jgi:K+-sensing histidine kinase KdpD|nr:hypothetical protein [Ktedonobacter sp.]
MLGKPGENMILHVGHTKAKDEEGTRKTVSHQAVTGDIAIIIDGKSLDSELVRLASLLASHGRCNIHLIHFIEVPRTLPLRAGLPEENEKADKLLAEALAITGRAGCHAVAEVVQVRDVGLAIIEEARDREWSLIILGEVRDVHHREHCDRDTMIPYVLAHAPCRVWVVQDPPAEWAAFF